MIPHAMLRAFAPWIPYLSVAIGVHLLGNAWATTLIGKSLLLALFWFDRRNVPWGAILRGWEPRWAVGAVLFGAAGGVLLHLLWPYLHMESALARELPELSISGAGWAGFVLYAGVLNPWFEELLWRGYLGSERLAPVREDLLFAGYHLLVLPRFISWPWVFLSCLLLVLAAWFWRQLAARGGGLLLPAISHVVATGSVLVAVWLRMNP